MFLILYILVVVLVVAGIYWIWRKYCCYWQQQGIQGPYGWPVIGNMWPFLSGQKHYGEVYEQIYRDYHEFDWIGIYRLFNEPAVIVRHTELIKDIMMRDFHHFQDNFLWIDVKRDPIISCNPFVAKGDKWRERRTEILPVFTPYKIRTSFLHIQDVCKKLLVYIEKNLYRNCFEAKNLFSRYTLDVIAAAGYGLEGQCLTSDNSDFLQMVENLFLPNTYSLLETLALLFSPTLGNFIHYKYLPSKVEKWLKAIINEILERRLDLTRQSKAEKANDFIQWLIDSKVKLGQPVDTDVIIGHCSTFLLEGFETSSSLMAFTLYELARNKEIQERVTKEIDSLLQDYGGDQLSYEALQEMHYLQAVLYETLRLYAPMMALTKECTEAYRLPPQCSYGRSFEVPKGTVFIIPVKAIHYDESLYQDPKVFRPERFLNENAENAMKENCKFLAFGIGARMCPGNRFGLLQSKAGVATLLSCYNVHLAAKSLLGPLKMSTTTFLTAAADGIWLKFLSRNKI